MKITDAFLGEHAVLYPLLDRLERADSGEVRAQAALLAAALHPHATLEDELLFDEVEPHLGSAGGPLAVMRAEHEEVKATLDALLEGRADPAPLVRRLVEVARAHFAKEEQILFPLAEDLLSAEALEAAGERWAERRLQPSAAAR